jgi:predicted CxxxxCH...CXXCH cytochrome family protein
VIFGALAKAAGASPVWDRTPATCSSAYCHGSTRSGGQHSSPTWTLVDGSQATCDSCHGYPPPIPHPASTTCAGCHAGTVGSGGAIDVAGGQHIDGQVQVAAAGCTICHGSVANPAPPVDTAGNSDTSFRGVGAHQAHLKASSDWHLATSCLECHNVPASDTELAHVDGSVELTWGTLALSAGAQPAFDGQRCSSVYCHGATLLPGGSNTSPQWTTVDGSQSHCGTCHGIPPGGGHPEANNCEGCHGQVVGAGLAFTNPQLHIDGQVQVAGAHPSGYRDPTRHGQDAKLGVADCRGCHGQDLTGQGSAVSCNDCHAAGWRTNCVFCHGGVDNQGGAPPVDLRGNTGRNVVAVGAHTKHVTRTIHPAWGCTQCHNAVSDVLTAGHMFDGTPGKSEVIFTAGLSGSGQYGGTTCSSLYCHGNGRAVGSNSSFAGPATTCGSCHASAAVPDSWELLSGEHKKHLEAGLACGTCHGAVVSGGSTIINPDLHVNGAREVRLPNNGTFNPSTRTCSGFGCHGSQTW